MYSRVVVCFLQLLPLILGCLVVGATKARPDSLQEMMRNFDNRTCNRTDVLAGQIDVCTKPLMDLIEGTLPEWPQTEDEIESLCKKFTMAEACIKDRGRRCAKGLNKVIVSTVAASIQRTRKRECIRKKYKEYLKLTKCIEFNLRIPHLLMANTTSRVMVVEKMKDPVQRSTGVCCAVGELEQEMYRLFTPVCKDQVPTLVRLYRSVMEDVLQVICPAVKCNNPYAGFILPEIDSADANGLVAHVMRIVFSLGS